MQSEAQSGRPCAQQLEGEEACEEGMCHTGFMSAAMDSWSGGFRVHAVIFPPRQTRSPTVCIQKRWRRSLSTSFYVLRMRSGVGVGGGAGFGGGRRKALQKERGRKKEKKSGNKRTTRSGRGQEGRNERMGKMKGEAYYPQTDGPLNSQRPPSGTRRDNSLHLRVTGGGGGKRGGAPLA